MSADLKHVVERLAREFLFRQYGRPYSDAYWQNIAIEMSDALSRLLPGDELPNGLIACQKVAQEAPCKDPADAAQLMKAG
ncbi:hypothetical protein [Nitratireductor sp. GCM10026969]|uniref:hypothetical protein n=1 Tax=Nitratireductor sp. GCM10026969 TaxID=3252645 RepID=UPI00361C1FCD